MKDRVQCFFVQCMRGLGLSRCPTLNTVNEFEKSCSRSADGSRGIAYFVEDPRLQTRPQTTRRGKIYWSAENFSQTITQGGKLEKIRDLLEFNENIDI